MMQYIPTLGPRSAKAHKDLAALTDRISKIPPLDLSHPERFGEDMGNIIADLAKEVFLLAALLDEAEKR